MNFLNRHNPDLFIFDLRTNAELEKIDLSGYKYDELHEYFAKKFGKIGEDNSAANEVNVNVENNDTPHMQLGNAINQLDRVRMNAEIFEGIGDNAINSSSMITSRAIYVIMFIFVVLFAIYAMAFNPSLIKRTSHICGCDSYFGAKATV